MQQLILMIHVLVAITLVVMILVQQGKGSDIGAAFGSGASGTVFGAAGSASFLVKFTAVLAAIFFITSLSLGYMASHQVHTKSVFEQVAPVSQPAPVKNSSTKKK